MDIFFEFEPLKRLCGVDLMAITPTTVNSLFGQPSEIETAENNGYSEESFTFHFHEHDLTLFFTFEKLLCIAISNPEFKLFGEELFKLREDELIYLFKQNGFPDHEIDKEWGEKQLVFDKAGVSIFFDNQKVSEIFIDV